MQSYDVTMILSTCAIIINAFANKFNCSKHDVTMVNSSQATVHLCNDYSSSNVLSFCSRWATWYSIVTDCNYKSSCWVIYWSSTAMCVPDFWWSNQKKMQNLAEANYHIGNIYLWLQTLWSSQREKHNYISKWYWIYLNINIISFSFLYGFSCIFVSMPGIFVSNQAFCVKRVL